MLNSKYTYKSRKQFSILISRHLIFVSQMNKDIKTAMSNGIVTFTTRVSIVKNIFIHEKL